MPEFKLQGQEAIAEYLDDFTLGYIEAMFFTASTGEGEPRGEDLTKADVNDLATVTILQIVKDCSEFRSTMPKDHAGRTALDLARVVYDNRRAGMDFWYTRNRHGTGYWDHGLGKVGHELTDISHIYCVQDLYRGDDGRLYLTP